MEKALKTITEMFYDRSLFDYYYKDVYEASLSFVVNDDCKYIILPCNEQTCIIFDLKKKVSSLDDIIQKYKHIILVTNEPIKESYDDIKLETFLLDELVFNISKHCYVPKHTLVDKKNANRILKDYNIQSPLLLPHILLHDPMAKYIGATKGDIVKIERNSLSSGEHTVFRVCV
jgi:DNA-directed RNA polymerase subunit H (RpoH/RPB5)